MRTTLPPISASYLFRLSGTVLLVLLLNLSGFAQGWEKTFGSTGNETAHDVQRTPDGGFILVGSSDSYGNNGRKDVLIVKTDLDGEELWKNHIGIGLADEYGYGICQTPDGGYIIGGTQMIFETSKAYIVKTDAFGNDIWKVAYNTQDSTQGRAIALTPDGGYAVAGFKQHHIIDDNGNSLLEEDAFIWKVDSLGYEQWAITHGGDKIDRALDIHAAADGSLYILGTSYSYSATGSRIYLLKINSTGQELWTYTYGQGFANKGHALAPTTDGGFIITGWTNDLKASGDDAFLLKVDANGAQQWMKIFEEEGPQRGYDVNETTEGGYFVVGIDRSDEFSDRSVTTIKTDAQGNEQWTHNFGGVLGDGGLASWAGTDGFAAAGFTRSYGAGNSDAYLIRMDTLGNSLSSLLTGNVFADFDLSCIKESTEKGIPGWLVHANGPQSYYSATDSLGNYEILADTGQYTLNIVLPNSYWELCVDSINAQITAPHDTVVVDFAAQPQTPCPALSIDISTPFLRRCTSNVYSVHYCNMGTDTAISAVADIQLDPHIQLDSSSIPVTIQRSPKHFFALGDLAPFECGYFELYVTLDCDSTYTGQTHCTEAHIFPDTLCQFVDSLWDGSSIVLDAICQGDSLQFKVSNEGEGDMTVPSGFVIIEDQIMLRQGDVILDAGEDTTLIFWPNGHTFRMEANQSLGHPGRSVPSIAVEGCGDGSPQSGFVIQFPQNDADPFLDIDCRESIASYDPNDKLAFPKGYGYENFISPDTDIEYLIRFQNTGTDTAFRVVIRDTLSTFLDIKTISPGASSHPYKFQVKKGNILQFVFDDIYLPDSSVNEAASNGFVKFRISQQADNPLGEIILNTAAIYFDFNAPIITDPTYHTIGENFMVTIPEEPEEENLNPIKIYPNPFLTEATVELKDALHGRAAFNIYTADGRLVRREQFIGKSFQFKRNGLPSGIYFFEIIGQHGQQLGKGKIVLK